MLRSRPHDPLAQPVEPAARRRPGASILRSRGGTTPAIDQRSSAPEPAMTRAARSRWRRPDAWWPAAYLQAPRAIKARAVSVTKPVFRPSSTALVSSLSDASRSANLKCTIPRAQWRSTSYAGESKRAARLAARSMASRAPGRSARCSAICTLVSSHSKSSLAGPVGVLSSSRSASSSWLRRTSDTTRRFASVSGSRATHHFSKYCPNSATRASRSAHRPSFSARLARPLSTCALHSTSPTSEAISHARFWNGTTDGQSPHAKERLAKLDDSLPTHSTSPASLAPR